jgi:hypothetical protein
MSTGSFYPSSRLILPTTIKNVAAELPAPRTHVERTRSRRVACKRHASAFFGIRRRTVSGFKPPAAGNTIYISGSA